MSERDKIMKMLEKHKDYFENVHRVDVAFSMKGDCIFYEYDDVHTDWIVCEKFHSAEELEELIEENIASDFCVNIQQLSESVLYSIDHAREQDAENGRLSTEERRTLINAFVAFTDALEQVYQKMQPFQKWVNKMKDNTPEDD